MRRSRLQRRKKSNLISLDSIYRFFLRGRVCFLVVGFTFGIIFSHLLEWTNFNSEYELIQAAGIEFISNEQATLLLHPELHPTISPSISADTIELPSPSSPASKQQRMHFDDPLLDGLQDGMSLIAKNPPNRGKNVRVLFIIGNEGSGHHVWQQLMEEMSKQSKMVNADYINDGTLLTELLHSCFMELHHATKQAINNKAEEAYLREAEKHTANGLFVDYSCEAFKIELER